MIDEKQLINDNDINIELKASRIYKDMYSDIDGNVYHTSQNGLKQDHPVVSNAGYLIVPVPHKSTTTTVQRVVASCWLANPFNLPEIDHKDDNRLNNRVSNLQWISHHDNLVKRHRMDSLNQKQTIAIAVTGDETITFSSICSAARHFHVSSTTMSGWVRDRRQHRGYSFFNSNSIRN